VLKSTGNVYSENNRGGIKEERKVQRLTAGKERRNRLRYAGMDWDVGQKPTTTVGNAGRVVKRKKRE